jgi:hypothetical protein
LKILLGFVGVLFFFPDWTITPVDEDADVSMLDAGLLAAAALVLLAVGSPRANLQLGVKLLLVTTLESNRLDRRRKT